MEQSKSHEITDLLIAWTQGDSEALEKLTPLVDQELRRIVRSRLRKEKAGQVLQTTEMVNEVYLRLIVHRPKCEGRIHFLGIAARLLRQILVDEARKRSRDKRGGQHEQVSLGGAADLSNSSCGKGIALDEVIAVHQGLDGLANFDRRKATIVELRYFGGLTEEEVAEAMEISSRTVRREWKFAQAYLYSRLQPEETNQEKSQQI